MVEIKNKIYYFACFVYIFLLALLLYTISKKDYVHSENLDPKIMQAIDQHDYMMVNQLISQLETKKSDQEMQEIFKKSLMYSFETLWDCPDCSYPPDFSEEEKINCENIENEIPGGLACSKCEFYRSIKIKEKLIELLDDVNIKNSEEETPLSLSLPLGNYDIFLKLIEKGALIEKDKGLLKEALFCSKNHFFICRAPLNKKIIKYFLDNGMNEFSNSDDSSPYKCIQERIIKCEKEIEIAEEESSKYKNNLKNYKEILNLFPVSKSSLISKKSLKKIFKSEDIDKYNKSISLLKELLQNPKLHCSELRMKILQNENKGSFPVLSFELYCLNKDVWGVKRIDLDFNTLKKIKDSFEEEAKSENIHGFEEFKPEDKSFNYFSNSIEGVLNASIKYVLREHFSCNEMAVNFSRGDNLKNDCIEWCLNYSQKKETVEKCNLIKQKDGTTVFENLVICNPESIKPYCNQVFKHITGVPVFNVVFRCTEENEESIIKIKLDPNNFSVTN